MLQFIHDRAQGWFAWAIIILISIPFALWGIESYLKFRGEPVAVEINGIKVSQRDLERRTQQMYYELREQLGAAYDPAIFANQRVRAQTLDKLIQETLLLDLSRRLGLRASDQDVQMQILNESAFQKDGRFNLEIYEQRLRAQGLTINGFEELVRQQLTSTQVPRVIAASEIVTKTEVSEYQRLNGQQREFSYARLPIENYQSTAPVDDTEIKADYEANQAQFQLPEQVKLDYLILDPNELKSKVIITDEDLQHAYEADRARFNQPERRKVSHLLRTLPASADEAATKKLLEEITEIRQRLIKGEVFAELAKNLSQDPGSAPQGGSLGMIEQGIMDPAFDQSAFHLALGEISEPVKTRFGYHLIKIEEILPAHIRPFAEVKEQIRADLIKQRTESMFYDLSERLGTLVYESPDSLDPAAEALGLSLQQSDWIGRTGNQGIFAEPKVIAAAFSEDVLHAGQNSEVIELEKNQNKSIVLRIHEHRDASIQPISEVKAKIVAKIQHNRAQAATLAAAEASAEKLRAGANWSEVLGELKPEEPGLVGRTAPKIPAAILAAAFRLQSPSAEKTASVGTLSLENGDAAIIKLTRVQDGVVQKDDDKTKVAESSDFKILARWMGRQSYQDFLQDLENRAKIERTELPHLDENQ